MALSVRHWHAFEISKKRARARAEMLQRMWTSAQTLRGREFCFILNNATRSDEQDLVDAAAPLARGINKLCVAVPPAPPFPPNDTCFRGGGFDDKCAQKLIIRSIRCIGYPSRIINN